MTHKQIAIIEQTLSTLYALEDILSKKQPYTKLTKKEIINEIIHAQKRLETLL